MLSFAVAFYSCSVAFQQSAKNGIQSTLHPEASRSSDGAGKIKANVFEWRLQAFGIPYAPLGDKVRSRRPMQSAPKTVLLEDEEKTLVQWLMELSHRGFGWTKDDVKDMVKTILDTRGAKTVFRDSWPGKDWMQAFFKRHPKVVERMGQAPAREIAVVTKESLAEWFQQMKQYLDALDPILLMSPGHAFNADESGFSVCPKAQKKKKISSRTGAKHVYSITNSTLQLVTVLACSSAVGQYC